MSDENPEMTFPTPATPKARKPSSRKPKKAVATPAKSTTKADDPRVNEYLTNIYRDKNGRMPDMKHIAVRKNGSWLRSLTVFVITIALFAGLGWLGYFWWSGMNKGAPTLASVSIDGPTSVTLGATTTYSITIQNTSDVALTKATLQVFYPTGFVFADSSLPATNAGHNEWSFGNVAAHTKKVLAIYGQNYGAVQTAGSWRAFLSYQPENFNSVLQESGALKTSIDTSPFELSVTAPSTVTPGSDAPISFALKSTGSWQPARLYLTPIVPAGFTISSSTPPLDINKRWVISSASSTAGVATRTFILFGSLAKAVDDTMPIEASVTLPLGDSGQLYELAHTSISPTVSKNGLAFDLAVNGSVTNTYSFPGDTLNITVQAKNTGDADIKNASIKLSLDAPSVKNQSMLQWANITDNNNGDVQGQQVSPTVRRGTITWAGKQVPTLTKMKPNDEVQIDLQLPIKDKKNFDLSLLSPSSTIRLTATLNYTNASGTAKTTALPPLTLQFKSDTSLATQDTVTENQHAITWIINNTLHTLKDITISAPAFGNIVFDSTTTPDGGSLTFDPNTKIVTWRIDAMPDSVDVLTAPFTLLLTKIDKSQNILVGKAHLTATDAVTNQLIDITADEILLK